MYDFGHKTGKSGTNLQYNYAVMKLMINLKKCLVWTSTCILQLLDAEFYIFIRSTLLVGLFKAPMSLSFLSACSIPKRNVLLFHYGCGLASNSPSVYAVWLWACHEAILLN